MADVRRGRRPARVVDGHDLVGRAYDAALAGDDLWHELGDSALLLP